MCLPRILLCISLISPHDIPMFLHFFYGSSPVSRQLHLSPRPPSARGNRAARCQGAAGGSATDAAQGPGGEENHPPVITIFIGGTIWLFNIAMENHHF